jgi:hypothetical protein
MTGHQSLQFAEHLRKAGHLRPTEAVADFGAADRPPDLQRDLPFDKKLWDITDPGLTSPAEILRVTTTR